MRNLNYYLTFFAFLATYSLSAQRLGRPADKVPLIKTKKAEPTTPLLADDGSVTSVKNTEESGGDTSRMATAEKLKADREKSAEDRLPFGPPQIEKRENVFGDNKEKRRILDKMEYRIGFITEGAGFNNTDLRKLDESTVATIQNTDDKQTFAFSRFYINLYFPLTENFYFRVDLFKNGFWGNHQLAGSSANNSSSSTPVGA
ncbi:MAG TPA: hypothetical protein PLY93_11020, partial [Turneriella sp.]|nr:hypothetical protein [Turneriella sp.]